MIRPAIRGLALVVCVVGSAVSLSCDVNDYCLNCAVGDGGPNGDSLDGGDADDGGDGDASDAGACVNTGPEVCDGDDNDCDGQVDEGALPTVGDACANQVGECAGGVKQCSNGVITCTKPPMPELCDLKDNDCNGLTDEGDPGGGAVCGTNTGECVAGFNRCVNGMIECVGAIGSVGGQLEVCNNRDDDCDGLFDENLSPGPCVAGVDGPAQGDQGECKLGTRACVGGVTVCQGAVFPSFEQCDPTNLDQDCDGQPSNGYNLSTDPFNCGMCGQVCNLPNAFEGCAAGACTIVACEPNHFNNNTIVSDGCEFDCGHPYLGNEVCNGVDDDCDGLIDGADPDLIPPAGICDSDGACSTMTTLTCNGAAGWVCNYDNPNVQKDAMGNIIPETLCDGDIVAGVFADNDCDGRIDEGQPNLGEACDNNLVGDCRDSGTYVCDSAARNGPAVCNYTDVGPGMSAVESCDGRDNNCNGMIDEGGDTGDLVGQEWIDVPNTSPQLQMMKYEASRPDASATAGGSEETIACSRAGVQPWTNVTQPTAALACASISARLCTEAEWQQMCVPEVTYPAPGPATTATTDFTFIEAEDAFANTTIGSPAIDRAWTRIAPASMNGVTGMQVPDTGFSVAPASNALAESSRLDFQLDLAASTNYRFWLRMRSPGGVSPYGVATAPTATLAPTSDASTGIDDLVIVTTWTRGGAGVPTHTLQAGFTELQTVSHNDGNFDGRLSVAYKVATVGGATAYQAYASSAGSNNYSGLTVLKAGAYSLAGVLAAGTNNTGGGPPDPPSAGATAQGSVVLAFGAWYVDQNRTITASAPSGFTKRWELAGNVSSELSAAAAIVPAGATADPGNFGDNTSNNNIEGTASVTVAIALTNPGSNAVWVGLTAGTTAGAASSADISTTADDQWQWVVSPQLTSGAGGGTHTFSIYTRQDGVIVDTIAVAQHTTAPTFDNSWSYETNPRTAQPQVCNADDYDTDPVAAGDQDGILPTGTVLPMCYANKGANDAYDMSGNVKEWTAARAPGQNPLRGGASNNEVLGTTCKTNFTLANDTFFFPNVGFRCCR